MLTALVPARSRAVTEAPPAELLRFMTAWLGVWPMPHRLRVAPSVRRLAPSASGSAEQFAGVRCDGRFGDAIVLSVGPLRFETVRVLVDQLSPRQVLTDVGDLMARIPDALERPSMAVVDDALRWTTSPADLPTVGSWHGDRLVATGPRGAVELEVRRINRFGYELVIDGDSADWGLSASLLAQAARHVLAVGAVPILRRNLDRPAPAAIASVAGFSDAGWRALSLAPRTELPTNRPEQKDLT